MKYKQFFFICFGDIAIIETLKDILNIVKFRNKEF